MKIGISYQNNQRALVSGKAAAETALRHGKIDRPDLVLAFCSGQLDHDEFFRGLRFLYGERNN